MRSEPCIICGKPGMGRADAGWVSNPDNPLLTVSTVTPIRGQVYCGLHFPDEGKALDGKKYWPA